jgi:mRNA interferase HigB
MVLYGEARIEKFAKQHAASRKPLSRFVEIVRTAEWRHLPDVKATFPGTDYLAESQAYVFNIGGNKCRLVAAIDFDQQIVLIEAVMTHEQYNRKDL